MQDKKEDRLPNPGQDFCGRLSPFCIYNIVNKNK